MVRLYRFYNWELSKDGEPFALCDQCRKDQVTPDKCFLNLIAHLAVWSCNNCGADNQNLPSVPK